MINPTTAGVNANIFANSQEHLLAAVALADLRIRWAVTRARGAGLDPEDEFRGLYIADDHIDQWLTYPIGDHHWSKGKSNGHGKNDINQKSWPDLIIEARNKWITQTQISHEAGVIMRLKHLIQAFSLTMEETEVFILALVLELDPRFGQIFAYLQDDVTQKRPSVGLILNLLTDNFSQKLQLRRIFGVNGRLIQSKLLHLKQESNLDFLRQNVRVYPHVVEFLLGDDQIDPDLAASVQLQPAQTLAKPKRQSPDFLAKLLQVNQKDNGYFPIFSFSGRVGSGKTETAQLLAWDKNQPLLIVNLQTLTEKNNELLHQLQCVLRDGYLYGATLYLKHWEEILQDGRPNPTLFAALLDYPHTVIVSSKIPWQPINHLEKRSIYHVEFLLPGYHDRLSIWQAHLGQEPNLDLTVVANHFKFTPGQIEEAVATARNLAKWQGKPLNMADIFAASRAHSNQNLLQLATKIQPKYAWEDIVLPDDTLNQLHEMVNTISRRPIVYDQWGFESKLALGKGLSAMFAGESGTGKTMAADIMAGVLGLDLYKVDLSTIVSKYIGETEKNLDRIFTEAATSNAVLFFDEADAIFGKRSEVKDSHDRYANIEVSYLLQRMEMYDGVVILATNLRSNMDDAFTRRLHFIVEFPFPETKYRAQIWQVNFPVETPVAADVDFNLLAERFPLAGGNIRNIILAAAFLAAEDGSVSLKHLLHAARREYQKMGRLIDEKLFI